MDGFRHYYKFIRPHSALGGKTPADMVGIDLNLGEKKWENLLRQSLRVENGDEEVVVKRISENRSLDQYLLVSKTEN